MLKMSLCYDSMVYSLIMISRILFMFTYFECITNISKIIIVISIK